MLCGRFNGTVAHLKATAKGTMFRGPGKGGVHAPGCHLSEVMALSAWMSVKNVAVSMCPTAAQRHSST
jgi:glutamate dehydrogenase/leucine dehydrogenase